MGQKMVVGYVAGQLGNQLFQRAAMEYANIVHFNSQASLHAVLGKGFRESPALRDVSMYRASWLETKICSLLIRPLRVQTTREVILRQCAERVLQILLVIRFRHRFAIIASSSISEPPKLENATTSIFLIGYFQDNFWSDYEEEIIATLRQSLSLSECEPLYDRIAIHVRLTDYLDSSDFGSLSPYYYERIVAEILRNEKRELDIEIFTDDTKLAKDLFLDWPFQVRYLGPDDLSSLETLSQIGSAKYRIIANSSFSWWAARLSQRVSSTTFYPTPWFMNVEGIHRFPPRWIPRNSYWLEGKNLSNVARSKH